MEIGQMDWKKAAARRISIQIMNERAGKVHMTLPQWEIFIEELLIQQELTAHGKNQ